MPAPTQTSKTRTGSAAHVAEPDRNCPLCPRLAAFRDEARVREPSWHNAPVPSWGEPNGPLLIVGLAPGLRGANRTGRPFTGDWAGDLLYATLLEFGLASGVYDERPDDSLTLVGCRVTNAVRCVPPQNKPTPAEINTCRPFLVQTINVGQPRAIVALGRIAHESVLRALGARLAEHPFGHGAEHDLTLPDGSATTRLFDSYHCSRYNTNTGVLTEAMFRNVFRNVRAFLN
ncbi:MAG: uracil-DNA glycosylase [Beijerinckiaceae bacterium]|nr:uracil-DNA glycosylase [Beijerinckiaceae bacterium]